MSTYRSPVMPVAGGSGKKGKKDERQPSKGKQRESENYKGEERQPSKGKQRESENYKGEERQPSKGEQQESEDYEGEESSKINPEMSDNEKTKVQFEKVQELEQRRTSRSTDGGRIRFFGSFQLNDLAVAILIVIPIVLSAVCFYQLIHRETPQLPQEFIDKVDQVEKSFRKLDDLEKINVKMAERNKKYDGDIMRINAQLSSLSESDVIINGKVIDVDHRQTKIADRLVGLEEETKTRLDRLSSEKDEIINEISALKEEKNKLGEEVSGVRTNLESKLEEQEHKVKGVESQIQSVSKEVECIKESKLPSIHNRIADKEKEMDELDKALADHQSLLRLLRENAFNKSVLMYVVLFLLLSNVFLIIAVIVLCRRSPGYSMASTANRAGIKQSQNNILKYIQRNQVLREAICVISYDEDRVASNQLLVQQGLANCHGNFQINDCVIRCHQDLLNVPPCKLTIMCVEFSERNVIIELPGIGQGDLRRTTYEALKKIGGKVMILYTRDPGSANLNEMYNSREIYCVETQPELVELHRAGRFFSVKDKFSNYQLGQFKTAVNRIFQ